VPVTLGGPFDGSKLGALEAIRFVAAPGAVVVTTELSPGPVRVVGLR